MAARVAGVFGANPTALYPDDGLKLRCMGVAPHVERVPGSGVMYGRGPSADVSSIEQYSAIVDDWSQYMMNDNQ